MTAFGAIHAREPVVRIAAFEEALDDALFEQALQASLGSQFREMAIGERLSASLLAWRHSGFSVHNGVRAPAGDHPGQFKPRIAARQRAAPASAAN